jgi:hypothetical protein
MSVLHIPLTISVSGRHSRAASLLRTHEKFLWILTWFSQGIIPVINEGSRFLSPLTDLHGTTPRNLFGTIVIDWRAM